MTKSSNSANFDLLRTYIGVMEMVEHGVIWLESSGRILGVNEQFARDLGYTKAEFKSKSIFEISPYTNLISWRKLWNQLLEEKTISIETEHITADGLIYPVRLKGVLIESGKDTVCCGIVENLLTKAPLKDLLNLTSRVSNIGSWQWNLLDNSILFTEEMYRLLDLPTDYPVREDSVMQLFKERTNEDDFERLSKQIKHSVKTGERFKLELVAGNSEKSQSFQLIGVPLFNDGTTLKMFGTLQNINEISTRTKDMYLTQFAVDKASDLIFWCNKEGKIHYVNQKLSRTLGYTKNELLEAPLSKIWPKISLSNWDDLWSDIKKEQTLEIDTNFLSKKALNIPIHLAATYVDTIDHEFICVFARNLSKKLKRDELIRLTYHTLDQAMDMIYWTRSDGSFVYVNETLCETLGYSEKEILNRTSFDLYPNKTPESFKKMWESLRRKEMLKTPNLTIKTKDGRSIPVDSYRTLMDYKGEECSCVILRNISEQKKKEEALQAAIRRIESLNEELKLEKKILQDEIELEYSFNNIISKDPNYKRVLKQVEQVSDTSSTVLITGETGTGKELLAQSIHQLGDRSERSIIKVNCGAIPSNLIESELFGHEKGAFTGAHQQKKGKFELAHKGTLFLDEIGEMPIELQPKLLRVLQEGEFQRVGGTQTIKVDVRVIAATNRNLEKLARKGEFREDLYYRLNVFPIHNIPLRERPEDIPLLIKYFVEKICKKLGKKVMEVPERMIKKLLQYPFPGNVRELENIIERAVIITEGKTLNLHASLKKRTFKKLNNKVFLSMEDMQKKHILKALKLSHGKVSGRGGAAELLKMNDKTLISRMKKLGIQKSDYLDNERTSL